MTEVFTLFSLFSGAGGLDLGFELTGRFKVIFGNDVFEPAVKTFSRNFHVKAVAHSPSLSDLPAVVHGNVAGLEFDGLEGLQPDVVSGGPPCQDFSIVGVPQTERGGISVSRGRLYSHFIRALIHMQPRVFVFENVPGLMSANRGAAYEAILEDFAKLNIRWDEIKKLIGNNCAKTPQGYEVVYSGLVDASKLGVPQARRRLIIIGVRKDLLPSAWWKTAALKREVECILQSPKGAVGRYPLTPLEVFEGRPLPALQDKYEEVMKEYYGVWDEVKTEQALRWKREVWSRTTFNVVEDYLQFNNIGRPSSSELEEAFREHERILKELEYMGRSISGIDPPDGSNRVPEESEEVVERMWRIPPDENHEFVRGTKWEVEGRGISLIYRRIHPLKPSYTVVAYGGGGT